MLAEKPFRNSRKKKMTISKGEIQKASQQTETWKFPLSKIPSTSKWIKAALKLNL